MRDINNREDIILLVNTFYEKVKNDETIGYLFTEVAKVNWEKHLPLMYDFWDNILFNTGNYSGNPLLAHKELNKKSALNEEHFKHWIKLFFETIDTLFEGKKASEIKERAKNIAMVISYKVLENSKA